MGCGKLCFLLQIMLPALTVVYYSEAVFTLNELAEVLDEAMDYNKDPCENFYDYVCGNWNKAYPKPNHSFVWNIHHMSKEIITQKIRGILEDRNKYGNKPLLSKERAYYDACMDVDYSLKEGRKLYKHIVKESKKAGPNWQDVAEYFADKIGEISFFHVTLGHKNELEIIRPSQTKSNKYEFNMIRKHIDIYLENKSRYLGLIKKQSLNASLKADFKHFVELISWQTRKRELPLIPVTIDRLQKMYNESCPFLNSTTQINWFSFLKKLAGPSGDSLTNLHNIYIDWSYLKSICEVLSSSTNDVIVQYLRFTLKKMKI
ncbi:neprilysin-1-like isoform X2 [Leptopilina heterotoma]|uniref:neprilysin-1-like isoform X2 n=1 Tax=Leptopilina heterotoma TaxID=63436 RepID=UPI001CA8DD5F|nr:neprilysin-1-like isoform X2 [Leptopilina heterotoma]XP_043478571.1 neprilysin-1-like isoform X2 [Leptopilina heterotoma]